MPSIATIIEILSQYKCQLLIIYLVSNTLSIVLFSDVFKETTLGGFKLNP